MTFEVASISFIQAEVSKVERIDMYAVLVGAGLWLVLEGFVNGYASTEAGVDRLHRILHDTIHPEFSVVQLHSWLHTELSTLTN
jgi:site-specific recombinase